MKIRKGIQLMKHSIHSDFLIQKVLAVLKEL